MDTLISTFHIDVKLIIAQMINFGIVFAILYLFAIKPIISVMRNRTKTIEKSLDDAKKIDQMMLEAEEKYNETLNNAKKESGLLLEKASNQAEEKRKEMLAKTKDEIGQIIMSEKAKLAQDKAIVLKEIKEEVAGLVAASVEKVLGKKMDKKEDYELIREVLRGKQ